jgi:hypothetical protein
LENGTIDEKIVQEILDAVFSSLEDLDTQSTAILQFLKDKGIADDAELASHLQQAGNASSVRWRAARVRIDYLLSGAIKSAEQDAQKKKASASTAEEKPAEKKPAEKESTEKESTEKESTEKETTREAKADTKPSDEKEAAKVAQPVGANRKSEADETSSTVEKHQNQPDRANQEANTKENKQQNNNQKQEPNNDPGKNADDKAA